MSNATGGASPSLKVVERQKRRGESTGGRTASSQFGSSSTVPLSASSTRTYDRARNGERGAYTDPLIPPASAGSSSFRAAASGRPTASGGLRRADTAGSAASDGSFATYRSNGSFLDASFVSAGRLNPDGGSYLRSSHVDPYGRDMSFRMDKPPTPLRSELYSREFTAAAAERPSTSTSVPPLESSRRPSEDRNPSLTGGKQYDQYGREIPLSRKATDLPSGNDAAAVTRSKNLAAWTRPALEARVETLERLLSEQQTGSSFIRGGDDRDLAEHLQVTVRKNRELRAELEVTKNRLAGLMDEREAFAQKLERDNSSLQSLLEEAERAKAALGNCIKALSAEKNDLAQRLALAEDEIIRLKTLTTNAGPAAAIIQFDEVRGNIEDVAVINEGLKESLRQMQLKNPSFNSGVTEIDQEQPPQ